MTPKEKAKELYNKFYYIIKSVDSNDAKECALLCVDQILSVFNKDGILVDGTEPYWIDTDGSSIEFWEQVKEEIKVQ